jgi:hypothetical protein
MDASKTLTHWGRILGFAAAGLCLFAGTVGLVDGQWRSIGMVALGLGFGLRSWRPTGGRGLQMLVVVLFVIAGTLAVVSIVQRAGR